jgi:hypothetical protein
MKRKNLWFELKKRGSKSLLPRIKKLESCASLKLEVYEAERQISHKLSKLNAIKSRSFKTHF